MTNESRPQPPSTALDAGDDSESREAIKKRQFEELGRYVQAFEGVVSQIRFTMATLLPASPWQQRLLNVILHHKALSAKPLFEMMQAMYGEIVNDRESGVSDEERKIVSGVLQQLAKELENLVKNRNALLHASWHVGASDMQAGALQVHKLTTRKEGLVATSMPATVDELRTLTLRCADVSRLILALSVSFVEKPRRLLASFMRENGKWTTTWEITVAT